MHFERAMEWIIKVKDNRANHLVEKRAHTHEKEIIYDFKY